MLPPELLTSTKFVAFNSWKTWLRKSWPHPEHFGQKSYIWNIKVWLEWLNICPFFPRSTLPMAKGFLNSMSPEAAVPGWCRGTGMAVVWSHSQDSAPAEESQRPRRACAGGTQVRRWSAPRQPSTPNIPLSLKWKYCHVSRENFIFLLVFLHLGVHWWTYCKAAGNWKLLWLCFLNCENCCKLIIVAKWQRTESFALHNEHSAQHPELKGRGNSHICCSSGLWIKVQKSKKPNNSTIK